MSMSTEGLLQRLDVLRQWQQAQEARLMSNHHARIAAIDNDGVTHSVEHRESPTANILTTSYQHPVTAESGLATATNPPQNSQQKSDNIYFNAIPLRAVSAASKLVADNEYDTNGVVPLKPKQPFLRKGSGLNKFGGPDRKSKVVTHRLNFFKGTAHRRVEQNYAAEKIAAQKLAESESAAEQLQNRTKNKATQQNIVESKTIRKQKFAVVADNRGDRGTTGTDRFKASHSRCNNNYDRRHTSSNRILLKMSSTDSSPLVLSPLKVPQCGAVRSTAQRLANQHQGELIDALRSDDVESVVISDVESDVDVDDSLPVDVLNRLCAAAASNNPGRFALSSGNDGSGDLRRGGDVAKNCGAEVCSDAETTMTEDGADSRAGSTAPVDPFAQSQTQSMYEKALEKELQIFEALERKVMQTSFSSTNSSVMQMISASTPHKLVPDSPREKADQITDEEIYNLKSISEVTNNSEDLTRPYRQRKLSYTTEDHPTQYESDSDGTSKCQSIQIIVRQNAAVNTDPVPEPEPDHKLKKQFAMCKQQLEQVLEQNDDLKCDKRSLEGKLAKEQLKNEQDLKDFQVKLSSEREKFNRDRLDFERQLRAQLNKPNRREREEISVLKLELENVREALKLKETRNGTTQARLRNQIKSLEKERAQTQDELATLRRQNARLQQQVALTGSSSNSKSAAMATTRRSSDTKILHEINRNITKLTQNVKQKIVGVGGSEASTNSAGEVKKRRSSDSVVATRTGDCGRAAGKEQRACGRRESCGSESNVSESCSTSTIDDDDVADSPCASKRDHSPDKFEKIYAQQLTRIGKRGDQNSSRRYSDNTNSQPANTDSHSSLQNSRRNSNIETRISQERSIDNNECGDWVPNKSSKSSDTNKNADDVVRNYERLFGGCAGDDDGLDRRGASRNENSRKSLSFERRDDRSATKVTENKSSKKSGSSRSGTKTVSDDGNVITVTFNNGDVKITELLNGVIRYHYASNDAWHSTFPDGTETIEFSNGQIEKRLPDGSSLTSFPDGMQRHQDATGVETFTYADGTVVRKKPGGEKVITMPNGQKEVHTNEHIRREYPDGTVKILYPDGVNETRYANGRIRLKNKDGDLLMDSHQDDD